MKNMKVLLESSETLLVATFRHKKDEVYANSSSTLDYFLRGKPALN
jgi:hypothetical protein